jgi:hypothetical protein
MASNAQTRERMDQAGDQLQDKARQTQQGAKDAAQNLTGQTRDAFSGLGREENPVEGFVAIWEKIPTNAYFLAAAGSILLSALLMLSGKQRAAIFVGQWPPTMIALALMNKLLRPSQEVSSRPY